MTSTCPDDSKLRLSFTPNGDTIGMLLYSVLNA
jgi:hypothetical protein